MSRDLGRSKSLIISLAALAVFAAAVGIAVLGTAAGRSLEGQTIDARFSLRGDLRPDPRIAIVAIDPASMAEYGDQSGVFPRDDIAKLITILHRDGARAIGVDIVFATPGAGTRRLVLASRSARNVVFASSAVAPPRIGNALCWATACPFYSAKATTGESQLPSDYGGIYRRMPYGVQGLPSLAVALTHRAGATIAPFPETLAWIDFAGPGGTYPNYPAYHVLRGDVPKDAFRGRIVLIGFTDPAKGDLHATPVQAQMPGVEIQANAVATLLAGLPLRSPPLWVGVLLVLAASLLAPVLGLRARPAWVLAGVVVAAAAALLADQLAFNRGWLLPAAAPLVALILAGYGTVSLGYVAEAHAREVTRDRFRRFVPADVVDDVLARAGNTLELGGEFIEATVVFTDLRSFTSFTEAGPAAVVVDALNRYLGEMTEAIHAHGGTLVSFMGDGIMAVFGAPIPTPDHADRAFAAAREMLEIRLPRINAQLRERGVEHEFRMGIGINSGVVMSGTIGSAERLEYTALGDTTNTASRIESMTKTVGESLLLTDTTRELLTQPVAGLVEVGDQEIRGRHEHVRLWTWRAPEPEPAPQVAPESAPQPSF
jgi:adenylate cyclase